MKFLKATSAMSWQADLEETLKITIRQLDLD